MMRFLNLKNQICEGSNSFAFYDTVTDEIIDFGGEQVFDDVEDFTKACTIDPQKKHILDRCLGLIPDGYFEQPIVLEIKIHYRRKPIGDFGLWAKKEIVKLKFLNRRLNKKNKYRRKR
jgi:hypothetical protein